MMGIQTSCKISTSIQTIQTLQPNIYILNLAECKFQISRKWPYLNAFKKNYLPYLVYFATDNLFFFFLTVSSKKEKKKKEKKCKDRKKFILYKNSLVWFLCLMCRKFW